MVSMSSMREELELVFVFPCSLRTSRLVVVEDECVFKELFAQTVKEKQKNKVS
jgi:hypothetical protein